MNTTIASKVAVAQRQHDDATAALAEAREGFKAARAAEIDALLALGTARRRLSPAAMFAKGARGTLMAAARRATQGSTK